MVIWLVLAMSLGLVCTGIQYLSVRKIDPSYIKISKQIIFWAYSIRILLIGFYFWQVVQQRLLTIVFALFVFLVFYFGSTFFIAYRKPHWLQSG